MTEGCRHVLGALSPDLLTDEGQAVRTDGQLIAAELASIRELLEVIAGSLFQIAGDASENDDRKADQVSSYLDGSPILD